MKLGRVFKKRKVKKKGEKEIALCEDVIERAVSRQMRLFKERRQAKWKYASASAF